MENKKCAEGIALDDKEVEGVSGGSLYIEDSGVVAVEAVLCPPGTEPPDSGLDWWESSNDVHELNIPKFWD